MDTETLEVIIDLDQKVDELLERIQDLEERVEVLENRNQSD